MSARLFARSGTPDHSSAGETSSPSHVYLMSIAPFGANAGDLIARAIGRPRWLASQATLRCCARHEKNSALRRPIGTGVASIDYNEPGHSSRRITESVMRRLCPYARRGPDAERRQE